MSAFIDVFVIGEGEEVILEVAQAYQAWKDSHRSRQELLEALADIDGVYVPSLYQVSYNPDGTVAEILPKSPQAKMPVIKRIVASLPEPLTNFLVPNVDVVHNRISVEIMRGCTRGCRFCHAGMVNRPIRERSVEGVIQAIDASL